mgnify:CR=1 FL=1
MDLEVTRISSDLRQNPTMLVPNLEERLTRFDGLLLKREGKCDLLTNEGAAAVEECIKFLKN